MRDRIGSVKNTKKITDAMKLVAAAKVRRAQEAVVNGRPFSENLVKVRAGIFTFCSVQLWVYATYTADVPFHVKAWSRLRRSGARKSTVHLMRMRRVLRLIKCLNVICTLRNAYRIVDAAGAVNVMQGALHVMARTV